MSTTETIVALMAVAMLSLCALVKISVNGAAPEQRPAILQALAEVLRNVWPTPLRPGGVQRDMAVTTERATRRRAPNRRTQNDGEPHDEE